MTFLGQMYRELKQYIKISKKHYQRLRQKSGIIGWLFQVLVIFLLINFLLYPGLGLLLGTSQPVVAVISSSMEHPVPFDDWWTVHQEVYSSYSITEQDFRDFPLENGFNQGDLIVLNAPKDLKTGDIIVFENSERKGHIIHRIVAMQDGAYTTKGDNNQGLLAQETNIASERIIGKALFRIPYLGNIRVITTNIIRSVL